MATIDTTLNKVFRTTPVGSIETSVGDVFYGLNHRQQPSPVPINKDNFGLTLFVRPQLNLASANIRAQRQFIPLMNQEPASIQRIVRCSLDPRLSFNDSSFESPFVDNTNAFIPILTNHLLTCTGWPDPVAETFTSKPGAYKEVYGHIDSAIDKFSSFDITLTFRNMVGDPITLLFYTWLNYACDVYTGTLSPYPDYLVKHELDYNTRIYRLVLDRNKRFVQKIACCGAAMPISVPLGSAFNFDSTTPLNMANQNISVNFRCFGYNYNDDIIVYEFNRVVQIFNTQMRDENIDTAMVKIPVHELNKFNNKGYPRINPNTYELEWFINKDGYNSLNNSHNKHLGTLSNRLDTKGQGPATPTSRLDSKGSAPATVSSRFDSKGVSLGKPTKNFDTKGLI